MTDSTLYLVTLAALKHPKTAEDIAAARSGEHWKARSLNDHSEVVKNDDIPDLHQRLRPNAMFINYEGTLVCHVIPIDSLIGKSVGDSTSELREEMLEICRACGLRFDLTSGNLPRTIVVGERGVFSLTRGDYEALRGGGR